MDNQFEYGFYNSKEGSERVYDANQFGRMFDGILVDGVFRNIGNTFKVTYTGEGMKISVDTGRAWYKHTFNYLKQPIQFLLDVGDSQYDRYDVVVLQVNSNEEIRENKILVKTGTPSQNIELPELLDDDDNEIWEFPLAIIKVPSLAVTLNNSDITNLVGLDTMPVGYEAYNNHIIHYSDVISRSEYGSTMINVHTEANPDNNESEWVDQSDENIGVYYTKTISNLTKFAKGAIFNTDLFVNTPSATNPISSIQLQEESFSYIFKYELNDNANILTLYSYYPTKIDISIRFNGKGVIND